LKLKMHTQILIAIVLAVVAGIVLGEKAGRVKIVGDIFIRLLKAIIIPLILASMVAGIVSLGDIRKLGRIGLRTVVYYMATTTLAVAVGLLLVNLIKPGTGVDMGAETTTQTAEAKYLPCCPLSRISSRQTCSTLWLKTKSCRLFFLLCSLESLSAASANKANRWSFSLKPSTRS